MYYKIINRKKKIATIIADIIGHTLWAPLNLFRAKNKRLARKEIKEILVIRTAYVGDVVMTMPMLKPLKETYPHARITFLTGTVSKELLLDNPYVDSVITYDAFWFYPKARKKDYLKFLKTLRSRSYDLTIEARGDIRDLLFLVYMSRSMYRMSFNVGGGGFLLTHVVPFDRALKHRVDVHMDIIKFLGGKPGEIDWGLHPTMDEVQRAESLIGKHEGGLIIGVHAGGRKGLKCWSSERYSELVRHISKEIGAKVVFTGYVEEKELICEIIKKAGCEAVNLAGSTDMRTLVALIGAFDAFITNDSAPLHIASAMGTPTVAIFGPSKSKETGPYGNIHRVVEKDFLCRFTCDEDVCNRGGSKQCMEDVLVDDVFTALQEVIEEAGKSKSFMLN